MSKLPSIKWNAGAERQREKLRAWLADWRIDRVISKGEAVASGVVFGLPPAKRVSCALQEGAVILIQPSNPAAAARPRYMALIEKSGAGTLLVAPFSRFGLPAIPGEFHLQSESLPVRVICLWNARSVRASALPPFWRVGCLTKRQREDAVAVWHCTVSARPVPDKLSDRVGPPLQHLLDPRHEYLEDETLWMDRCLPRSGNLRLLNEDSPAIGHSALPIAAEKRARYRTRRKPRRNSGE